MKLLSSLMLQIEIFIGYLYAVEMEYLLFELFLTTIYK